MGKTSKPSVAKILALADKKFARAKELEQEANILQKQAFKACPHNLEDIRETAYKETFWVRYVPLRVCISCGYAEEGWTFYMLGKQALHGEVAKISEEKARKYIRQQYPQWDLSRKHCRREETDIYADPDYSKRQILEDD